MSANRTPRTRPSRRLVTGLAATALLAGACGSSGAEQSSGVASLQDGDTVEEADSAAVPGDDLATAEDAALAFSACMRAEGLDFPDIGVDADGNPEIRDAFQAAGVDPGSPEFRDAMATCGELLADAGFGGGRGARADDPARQDAFVAYSGCLRDEGLDVGDLVPGGGAAAGAEDGPQRGQGRGSGDRIANLARALGVDPDDPAVAAGLEACAPILDDALGQGPGAAD